MKCLIISGGQYYIPQNAKEYDYIIGCDKGYQYSLQANLKLDLLIGDFDSYQGRLDPAIPTIHYPIEKDDTDTMLAIKHALQLGYQQITLCCCFGGRLDHLLANIQAGKYIADHQGQALLVDENTQIYITNQNHLTLTKIPGYSLSLFALTDQVEDLTIHGTKYLADHITLTNGFPLGVSNQWDNDTAEIHFQNGTLMVVCSNQVHER